MANISETLHKFNETLGNARAGISASVIALSRSVHALALLRFIKPPLTDKEIVAKEKEVNVFEIVSGLADGAGFMPAKWSRRVFWLRSYEGKISCESFELASPLLRGPANGCF